MQFAESKGQDYWLAKPGRFWTWLIILLFLSMTILGQLPAVPAFLVLIFFAFKTYGRVGSISLSKRIFLFLILQYILFHGLKVAIFDGLEPLKADLAHTYAYYWIIAALLVGLLYVFFEVGEDIPRIFQKSVPVIVIISFCGLTADYLLTNSCRVSGLNNLVFFGPLILTTLAIMWMAVSNPKSQRTVFVSALMIAASVVASTAYAGTRGIFVAQFATFGVLFVYLIVTGKRSLAAAVAVGAVGGLASGYLIDVLSACNFSARTLKFVQSSVDAIGAAIGDVISSVQSASTSSAAHDEVVGAVQSTPPSNAAVDEVVSAVQSTPTSSDAVGEAISSVQSTPSLSAAIDSESSASQRVRLWQAALGAFAEAPIFGHGVSYEFQLTGPIQPHVHNIYLSWLVWGGVFSLLSGMAFLLSTVLYRLSELFRYDRFLMVCALPVFWGFAQVFDSFLILAYFFVLYMFYSFLAVYLIEAKTEAED